MDYNNNGNNYSNNNNGNNDVNNNYGNANNYGNNNYENNNYGTNNNYGANGSYGVYGNYGTNNMNPNNNNYNSGYANNTGYNQENVKTQDNFYSYTNTVNNANNYQQNANTAGSVEIKKNKKEKKEKKKGSFIASLGKCVALALVFGLVSGGVMTGVYYGGVKALKIDTTGNTTSNTSGNLDSGFSVSEGNIGTTGTANTYVAVDVSDIVEQAMPSIVAITNISETEYQSFWGGHSQVYESTSYGSGIIVRQDSQYLYIATNNHVVNGAKTLTVTFSDESTVSAEVKGTDPSIDLAVVKVALSDIDSNTLDMIKVATIGTSGDLRVGESCIAVGNALGYGQSVTTGVISALDREVSVSDSSSGISYTADLIQTDAAINPGNSGGALLDSSGALIGINSVKYADTDVEGIGYAIPIDTAAPVIEELITKEKVESSNSSYLGIAGVDVTSEDTANYNMPIGVYVAQVMDSTAAEQYGILQGDIITAFDGKEIKSMESLTNTLQYYAAGTTVEITVQRMSAGQYQEVVLSVVLGRKH